MKENTLASFLNQLPDWFKTMFAFCFFFQVKVKLRFLEKNWFNAYLHQQVSMASNFRLKTREFLNIFCSAVQTYTAKTNPLEKSEKFLKFEEENYSNKQINLPVG